MQVQQDLRLIDSRKGSKLTFHVRALFCLRQPHQQPSTAQFLLGTRKLPMHGWVRPELRAGCRGVHDRCGEATKEHHPLLGSNMGSMATKGRLMSDASSQCQNSFRSLAMIILHSSDAVTTPLRADAGKGRSVVNSGLFPSK